MTDSDDTRSESSSGHTTISVKRDTFQRVKSLKRDGTTWDLFLRDMADDYESYENMRGNISKAKVDLILDRASKTTPTLSELEEIEKMVEKGETELDEADLEELRKNLRETRDMEREVFD